MMLALLPYFEIVNQFFIGTFFAIIVVGVFVASSAFGVVWETVVAFLSGLIAFFIFFGAWYYPRGKFTGHDEALEIGVWMGVVTGISLIIYLGRKLKRRYVGRTKIQLQIQSSNGGGGNQRGDYLRPV